MSIIHRSEKEDTPDFSTGIKQSGNAKITFKDEDYFIKVCEHFVSAFITFSYGMLHQRCLLESTDCCE